MEQALERAVKKMIENGHITVNPHLREEMLWVMIYAELEKLSYREVQNWLNKI